METEVDFNSRILNDLIPLLDLSHLILLFSGQSR